MSAARVRLRMLPGWRVYFGDRLVSGGETVDVPPERADELLAQGSALEVVEAEGLLSPASTPPAARANRISGRRSRLSRSDG